MKWNWKNEFGEAADEVGSFIGKDLRQDVRHAVRPIGVWEVLSMLFGVVVGLMVWSMSFGQVDTSKAEGIGWWACVIFKLWTFVMFVGWAPLKSFIVYRRQELKYRLKNRAVVRVIRYGRKKISESDSD